MRDSPWPWRFQLLKAEILLTLNRASDARNLLESVQVAVSRWRELAPRLLMDYGEVERQSGRSEDARKLLGQALDLASREGDTTLVASIELRRGLLLYDSDRDFDGADGAFRHALDLATAQRDDYLIATAFIDLGYIRLKQFRYDEAIPLFEAADRAARSIPSKVSHEKCLGNLGWCYFRLGQLDRALDLYSEAAPLAAEIRMAVDQQRWLGNIGSIYYAREKYDQAISYYLRARDIEQGLGNRADVATWLNNITRAYIDQSKWDEAEKFNQLALAAEAGSANEELAAYSQLNRGFIATARKRATEAEASFESAIRHADASHQPNVGWQAHSGLAELYRVQNRSAAALRQYATAMDLLDREWLALSRDESKITFRGYLASVYQDYVGFLSERHQKEKALEVAESSRARLLAQKLEGRSSALPHFRVAEAIRLAGETRSALLSYWLAPDRSYVWAVTAKGVSQFVLTRQSEISALVERHRRATEGLEDPLAGEGTAARELYRALVAPVEPLIHSAAQVFIVPDGPLHEINFETLVVGGAKPHYWIEDANVAVVPSLSILRAEKPGPVSRPRLLIIGDPAPADPEFPPLPHLRAEIREIAANFPEADRAMVTGAEAYPARFRESDPRAFTAIHFAAHASANEESPLNSAIILSPHGGKYKLYASEVADLRLNPELVTISACRSAGSKAYSGEGLIGFAWAFLEAGAHNVVAGVWNVDDAAAPLLMKEFYAEWREGRDPARALRGAKLKLMRSGGVFRKPYYWGPFEVFTRYATRSAMDLAWRNSSK
jgi:CHAT domain-containing protein/Tfp pilus assembly protein PilF